MRLVLASLFTLVSTTALAEPSYTLDGHYVRVPGQVAFETGSAKLTPDSEAALTSLQGYLTDKSYISTLRIEGHTDADGSAAKNQALSEARALAIAKFLVAHGVDCKRLLPVGFGSSKPIASNDTPDGKAQNRRMEFVNAALRGHAIGGMPLDGGGRVAGDPCQ